MKPQTTEDVDGDEIALKDGSIGDEPGVLVVCCVDKGMIGEQQAAVILDARAARAVRDWLDGWLKEQEAGVSREADWSNVCSGMGGSATGPKCCERAGEYNGFGSGPTIFTCPVHCCCHD